MISFRLQRKYRQDDANWDTSYFITTLVCFKAAAHLSNKITGNKNILCVSHSKPRIQLFCMAVVLRECGPLKCLFSWLERREAYTGSGRTVPKKGWNW